MIEVKRVQFLASGGSSIVGSEASTRKARPPKYEPLLHAGMLYPYVTFLVLVFKVALDSSFAPMSDFGLMYETIERVRQGLPMYGPIASNVRPWNPGPNFNPPHFYILIQPFAALPLSWAFTLWVALSVLAGAVASAMTARSLAVRKWSLAYFGLTWANVAYAATICGGQLSLILALPVTLAWRAVRSGRWGTAGLWLGLAASIKPFLLIAAPLFLKRGRRRAIPALALSAGVATLLGVLQFGPDALRQWLAILDDRSALHHFENASLTGFLARVVSLTIFEKPATLVVLALGCCLTVVVAYRDRNIDRAWLLLMAGALLWSPLGWVYYGWFLMPPLAAMSLSGYLSRSMRVWLCLWLWPPFTLGLALAPVPIAATLGSIYFWGLATLWTGIIHAASFRADSPAIAATGSGQGNA